MILQKSFKKSLTVRMGIPRKGCNSNKSLSPVMMQDAFAATANSRNLLSLGSRQTFTLSDTSMNKAFCVKSSMMANLVSREIYLSNLFLTKTSQNSLYVSMFDTNFFVAFALLYARVGFDCNKRKALTRVFVSRTKKLFLIQQLFKNFFSKSIFCSFSSGFIQKFLKLSFFISLSYNFYLLFKKFFEFVFNLRGRFRPLFCGSIIHFNYNLFQKDQFYLFSNLI